MNPSLDIIDCDIAKAHDDGIAWVIMRLMKRHQIFMCQIRDLGRITARIIVISRRRKQMRRQGIIQLIDLATHRPFHFIKYNAVVFRLIVLIDLNANTLLGKVKRMNVGKKHRIQIHRQ